MNNTYTLKLDIKKAITQAAPVYTCGDTAVLKMELYDNDSPVNLETAGVKSALLYVRVGNGDIIRGVSSISGNYVTYQFGAEMENTGKAECKLMLYGEGNITRISTMPFSVFFDSTWTASGDSGPVQDIITVLLADVAEIKTQISNMQLSSGHYHDNISLLNSLVNNGAGDMFLANDGTYKLIEAQSGGGDMSAAVYDTNLSGIVDKAESINDGAGNTATAAEIRGAVNDKHSHLNKNVIDKIAYTGTGTSIDLKTIEDNASSILLKAPLSHVHNIGDISSLQTELDGKAGTIHGHTVGDIASLQTTLDGKAATAHGHSISDISNLQTSLDGKATISHGHAATDITQDSTHRFTTDAEKSLWNAGAGLTIRHDTIFDGNATTGTYNVTSAFSNYSYLLFNLKAATAAPAYRLTTCMIKASDFMATNSNSSYLIPILNAPNYFAFTNIYYVSSTSFNATASLGTGSFTSFAITKIYGIY